MLHRQVAEIVGLDWTFVGGSVPERYSSDGTFITARPDLVVLPADAAQTAAVVRLLYENDIAIIGRGAGTGLSGGAVAIHGGAIVSLERLTNMQIDPTTLQAHVGAGVLTGSLREAAQEHGLLYPPDPASIDTCTIGGNISTNAGGPACIKYGVTSEYVMELEVVTFDGELVKLGGRTRKRSSGYRLAQLFVGSEGTLGLVTSATVRLVPMPKHVATVLCSFDAVAGAGRCVEEVLRSGVLPSACELLDRSSIGLVADLFPAGWEEAGAVLLAETDGMNPVVVEEEASQVATIAKASGAKFTLMEVDETGRERLWAARRAIGKRLIARKDLRLPEDVCVPINRIAEMAVKINEICTAKMVGYALFGHAGDGNLHPSLIFSSKDPSELRRVEEASRLIFEAALDLGGTVSAEHGLGALKAGMAVEDIGGKAIKMMAGIKQTLDPKGLFNPGKIFSIGDPRSLFSHLPGWL